MTIGGGGGGAGGGGAGRGGAVAQPAKVSIATAAASAQTLRRDSNFERRKALGEKRGTPAQAIAKRLIRG